MATTSIWRVKGSIGDVLRYAANEDKTGYVPGKTDEEQLGDVIGYASRPEATDSFHLVTGINCDAANARDEMMSVKRRFRKTGGTVAYHGYQSFAEGEVTPQLAHQLGISLAEKLWGDRYQVLVTTHLDKESHIHNHFVVNTVSFVDGIKYHRTQKDYYDMQRASDQLCREHGLSVVRHPEEQTGKHYAEWKAEKEGGETIRGKIREDIDRAVGSAVTFRQFCSTMKAMGYELKLYTAKGENLLRPSLRPEGSQKFYRFDSLGKGYGMDSITDRILSNMRSSDPFPEEEKIKAETYRKEHPKHTKAKGLAALYYHYCCELHIIKEYPGSVRKVSKFLRDDLIKLDRLDEQVRFLAANGIETIDDLNSYRQDALAAIDAFEIERRDLRNQLRSAVREIQDPEDSVAVSRAEGIRSKVRQKTKEIAEIRKTLKMCDIIEERSVHIPGELEALSKAKEPEISQHGQHRDERKR